MSSFCVHPVLQALHEPKEATLPVAAQGSGSGVGPGCGLDPPPSLLDQHGERLGSCWPARRLSPACAAHRAAETFRRGRGPTPQVEYCSFGRFEPYKRPKVKQSPLNLWFVRLLFWAQTGDSPKIERSGLDGRDRKSVVTRFLRLPLALSLGSFSSFTVLPSAFWAIVKHVRQVGGEKVWKSRKRFHYSPHLRLNTTNVIRIRRLLCIPQFINAMKRDWTWEKIERLCHCCWFDVAQIFPGSCSTGRTRELKPSPGSTLRAVTVRQW